MISIPLKTIPSETKLPIVMIGLSGIVKEGYSSTQRKVKFWIYRIDYKDTTLGRTITEAHVVVQTITTFVLTTRMKRGARRSFLCKK